MALTLDRLERLARAPFCRIELGGGRAAITNCHVLIAGPTEEVPLAIKGDSRNWPTLPEAEIIESILAPTSLPTATITIPLGALLDFVGARCPACEGDLWCRHCGSPCPRCMAGRMIREADEAEGVDGVFRGSRIGSAFFDRALIYAAVLGLDSDAATLVTLELHGARAPMIVTAGPWRAAVMPLNPDSIPEQRGQTLPTPRVAAFRMRMATSEANLTTAPGYDSAARGDDR